MPYDLTDLAKWRYVPADAGLDFPTTDPRKVRLEVLAETADTRLWVEPIAPGKRVRHCIGVFHGYDVVKFQIDGPFRLLANGAGCKIWTPETVSAGAREMPDAVSFTTMMTRRVRNPEMERMMHKMQQNVERRLRIAERDMELRYNPERRLADIEKSLETFRAQSERERRAIIENPDDDGDELESQDAGAGDGDGLQKRGGKPGGSKLVKKPVP